MGLGSFPGSPFVGPSLVEISGKSHLGHPNVPDQELHRAKWGEDTSLAPRGLQSL